MGTIQVLRDRCEQLREIAKGRVSNLPICSTSYR